MTLYVFQLLILSLFIIIMYIKYIYSVVLQKYQTFLSIGIDNIIDTLCINHTSSSTSTVVKILFKQVC